jgi:hypothetical protein
MTNYGRMTKADLIGEIETLQVRLTEVRLSLGNANAKLAMIPDAVREVARDHNYNLCDDALADFARLLGIPEFTMGKKYEITVTLDAVDRHDNGEDGIEEYVKTGIFDGLSILDVEAVDLSVVVEEKR